MIFVPSKDTIVRICFTSWRRSSRIFYIEPFVWLFLCVTLQLLFWARHKFPRLGGGRKSLEDYLGLAVSSPKWAVAISPMASNEAVAVSASRLPIHAVERLPY